MPNQGALPIRIEIPTQFEMGTVNCYLYKSPVPTLIDCGEKSEASWNALKLGLASEGLTIHDIERIIITHAHVDHIGMAAKVAEASGAKVWVSDMVKPWAIDLDRMQKVRWGIITDLLTQITNQQDSPLHQGFAKFFNNYVNFWDPIPSEVLEIFHVGDNLELGDGKWEVMHAPGHCINQTCFYNHGSQELMAADMLLKITSTPVIDASLADETERTGGLTELVATLRKFNQLKLSTVYPGHYEEILDGNALIQRQLDRIDQRIEQTYGLVNEGPKSFFEILNHMYRGRMSGPAIPMMIGYLDVLVTDNRINCRQSDQGLIYFISDN